MFRYTAVGLGTSRRTCGLCFQAVGLSTTRRGGSGGERILDGYTTSRQAQRIEPGPFQPQPSSISDMVDPIAVRANKSTTDDDFLAAESLTGSRYIERVALMQVLNTFSRRPQIRQLAADEAGMDDRVFRTSIMSFRRFCLESTPLPLDLHVLISDIVREARSVDELYAPFIQHARKMYPHLEFMEDLRQISNFREPHQWYAEARGKQRRVVFHAGPTNSGKTYHALKSFMAAKSGVYCGPLKLLVNEIFYKTVDAGQECDLITGEEQRHHHGEHQPASHLSCTVEMVNTQREFECAVIDEIQMMRDLQRGWAWTRALLGVNAHEVHVCGEASAIDLVRELCTNCGDDVEVRRYERMTGLSVADRAVENYKAVVPGDCIVCFSKNDIFKVSRQLHKQSVPTAIIYGSLPPNTKLQQAAKFNDPASDVKTLITTDAIGMGINLSIKRIIFYSLVKPVLMEYGDKIMDHIPNYTALQIAGRAGRFGTDHEEGVVTTFFARDLPVLKRILKTPIAPIERAGLYPTLEQIETFSYYLPNSSLTKLIDIFMAVCELDPTNYFMCDTADFKFLASSIDHIPLPIRERYLFCHAPINRKNAFTCAVFVKFARRFSEGYPLTLDFLCTSPYSCKFLLCFSTIGWPLSAPRTLTELMHLEAVFDVLDMYLWLSFRFADLFPDAALVRDVHCELDIIIQDGVSSVIRLILEGEKSPSMENVDSEPTDFVRMSSQKEATQVATDRRAKAQLNQRAKNADDFRVAMDQLIAEDMLSQSMRTRLLKEWRQLKNKEEAKSRVVDESGSGTGDTDDLK